MAWQESSRDQSIDIVRSIAIITMIFSNMAPLLSEPHGMAFRLFGSFAAPLFIIIVGMMISLTVNTKHYTIKHYLLRGFLIILVGISIDISFWKIYPLMTVDILYLIGISIPITYLLGHFSSRTLLVISIAIFVITPFLQNILGYTYYPTEYYLSGNLTVEVEKQTSIIHHWIIDGWFPLFPWLGYAIFGAYLGKLRWSSSSKTNIFNNKKFLLIGFAAIIIGGILWYIYPGLLYSREGYSETFFPPTIGYIVVSIGVFCVVLSVSYLTQKFKLWTLFIPLGESSLLIYIIHIAVISRIYLEYYEDLNLTYYVSLYLALLVSITMLSHIVRLIKLKSKKMPYLFQFLLGR